MRKLIFALLLLLAILLILSRMTEMQAIAETFQRGEWGFILLALGLEVVWLVNVAASYRAIYRLMGIEEKFEKLAVMSSAAFFVDVVAPSAGMGGIAVFIAEAKRRGYSAGRVTVAGVLFILFDYAAFLCVLGLGLLVLIRRNNLNSAELIASAILVLAAVVISILLYLGMRSADKLSATLVWMARLVNRLLHPFVHRDYLSVERAHEFAQEAAEGLQALRQSSGGLLLPFVLALSSKALLISILFLMFMAFTVPFSVGTLIAGFSIGYLFMIVSPTPAGVGVVEGALTLALTTLNVPLGAAAVLTLAFRGITFWIPFFIGLVAFRWVSHTGKAADFVEPQA